jgi:hypothetical protein
VDNSTILTGGGGGGGYFGGGGGYVHCSSDCITTTMVLHFDKLFCFFGSSADHDEVPLADMGGGGGGGSAWTMGCNPDAEGSKQWHISSGA